MKTHEGTLKAYFYVKEASLKILHIQFSLVQLLSSTL